MSDRLTPLKVRDDWTSYRIHWDRANAESRPDFDHSARAMLYLTTNGEPLFTVVTHGYFLTEGVFTLIALVKPPASAMSWTDASSRRIACSPRR